MVLPLIVGIISGAIVGVIAEQKNRPFFPWAVYGFLFFFIAIIHLAAIGDRKYEEKESEAFGFIKCPSCGGMVKGEAGECRYCKATFQSRPATAPKTPGATAEFSGEKKSCRWCKEPFKPAYGNKCPACGGLQVHFLKDNPLLIILILCLMIAFMAVFSQVGEESLSTPSQSEEFSDF
ncbi:hypothetical protein JYT92_00040 [bacterium AH-315-L15]|nr:hypothetical protein [bacterium AH-315-L15]